MAHPFHEHGTGFTAGFMHPFLGLDHLLAMIAVGLWAAQLGGRWRWLIPLTFVSVMLGGGMLGFAGVTAPLLEPMIAASVLALGLLVMLRIHLNLAGVVLTAVFALFHGIAHGAELPVATTAFSYASGFMIATTLLHLLGIAAGLRIEKSGQWAGAPIAAAGCWLLAGAVLAI